MSVCCTFMAEDNITSHFEARERGLKCKTYISEVNFTCKSKSRTIEREQNQSGLLECTNPIHNVEGNFSCAKAGT